jgi:hypothetical protein
MKIHNVIIQEELLDGWFPTADHPQGGAFG